MTTITIKENIKLTMNNFNTYEELVTFILYDNTKLEIEELNNEEKKFINSLDSFNNFKNVANLVG